MNYPYVLLFRHDDCSSIDSFISSNSSNINATIFITNNLNELNKLYNPNYQIIISYGANIESIFS